MMEHVEQQLGNYRLIQLLGKGAFADVYLGEHLYVNVPPVRDRRLLRSCRRWPRPDRKFLVSQVQNNLR